MRARIRASARFPLEGTDWARKLLVGGAIGLLYEIIFVGLAYLASEEAAFAVAPLAVMVNFAAIGYAYRVYSRSIHHQTPELPEWEDWKSLFYSGIVVFIIAFVYGMVPILLLLVGLSLLVKGGLLLLFGMVLMVLGILAGVFTLFFFPMAMAHYIAHRRLEAAFQPALLWEGINRVLAEYVATYLFCIGLFILGGLTAAIPYVGALSWPFLWFYLLLVQARLFGDVCVKAI